MNTVRYEQGVKRAADRLHQRAQETGIAADYIGAATLYEKCGEYNLARICREAAARLPQ
jgi:hypothetical protein